MDTTERGFAIYASIKDAYGSEVRVQKSSAASKDCVWIFCENDDPQWKRVGVEPSPHLTVDQAKVVRDALDQFIREHSEEER